MNSILPSLLLARALLGASPCEIRLEGETDQASLRSELGARDLMTERRPACIGPVAHVASDAGRYVVSLRFEDGVEIERRVVGSEKTVATLIESWMRDDLAASLLEPVTPPIPSSPPTPSASSAPVSSPEVVAPVESASTPETPSSFELGLGTELAADLDGHPWFGVAGLVRPWASDFAPLFLLRFNLNSVGGTPTATGASRSGLELMALFEPRFGLGTFWLRPAVGAGLGLLHSRRGEDRECTDACPLVVQDDFAATHLGPRLELRLAMGHAIGGGVSFEISAGATLSPLAEEAGLIPDYASESLSPSDRELLALPGEPLLLARGSVAIVWEGP